MIARYRKSGSLQSAPYRRHRFPQCYTRADVELLAIVDEAHDNLSEPATRRILEREYRQYGECDFKRLASLSVSHLYNSASSRAIANGVGTTSRRGPQPPHVPLLAGCHRGSNLRATENDEACEYKDHDGYLRGMLL